MSAGSCIKEILLSECLDGELPAKTEGEIRQHLSGCPECRAVYERMKAESGLLRESLPNPGPPAHMRQQLLQRIDAEPQRRSRFRIMNWIGLGQPPATASGTWARAAACVAFLAVVVSGVQFQRHLENRKMLAEIDRSVAQWAAQDFSLNPFNVDMQGAPFQVKTENPFKPYLNER